ncbi:DUF4825 domain-containing protein [Turicibacter sp. TJ11]|uniref:DUF4825 domain-containing protein n=1 Tax=Turicibacter sp. TJ11 TaxID=2806443 RepID=UPI001F23E8B0|nr:DUF4825 domain-containing protein [Turicibacter sp. TJ11]
MKRLMMVLMLTLLALVGCKQSNPMTELLNYKGSYIGDNAAVGHIIERLPAHEYLDGFELQTSQEPYGITINYKNFDEATIELEDGSTSKVSLNEILQSNSMMILSLVKNAEIVSFNIENQETITFDRATLSKTYGNTLDSISEDLSSLQNFIKSYAHK